MYKYKTGILTPNRLLAYVIIAVCVILLARYIYQSSRLEGFQQYQQHSHDNKYMTAPRSRFIFAGYNPLYDLIFTQALLKHLDASPVPDSHSTDMAKMRFRDVPRLYLYWIRSAPDNIHVFISTLRKPQTLIDLVEHTNPGNKSGPALEAAMEQQIDNPVLDSVSQEADRLGQMLTKYPPATLNLTPTSKQREQMRSYVRFFVDNNMMPLADIKLTEPDASYLDLDPILATAPNPDDDTVMPEIYMRDPAREVFTALFQREDALRVNIVTPAALTEGKKLAAQAASRDTISTIRRTLFSNPDGPKITPSRVTIFRHKTQTSISGATQVIIYFRLADDELEASQSQLLAQLEQLGVAQQVQTSDNPHYPDYLLPRVPVHDFQQVQVLIRSTERGWEAV